MSNNTKKKDKLINLRIMHDFLNLVDKYWRSTNRFSNRTEFITYLLQEELKNQTLKNDVHIKITSLEEEMDKIKQKFQDS